VDRAVEALADEDDGEREREKRQSMDVPQSQIVSEEIAHIGAEDAGKAERGPVSGAKCWQVNLLHGDRLLSDGWFQAGVGGERVEHDP
jgi:hypothetical protein